MFSLFKYLRGYRKELILGPFFKLVEAVFELIIPLVMAQIIDVGVKNADEAYVWRMGWFMVLLAAVGLCSALVCQYFASRASQGFGTVLRNEMFRKIHKMSQTEINQFGVPSLITRVTNDVTQLQQAVAMLIRLAIRAPFLVIGATVMALIIDPQMALIFVVASVVIAAVLYFIMSRSVPFYRIVQKLLDNVSLRTREALSGVRVIRAFSKQKTEEKEFDDGTRELSETQMRVGRISALLNPATYLIVNIAIICIIYFGGFNVDAGRLEQGQIFALVQYMTQIMLALVVVANLVILFTRANTSAARVKAVLDVSPSITDGPGVDIFEEGTPAVQFENVCFAYGDHAGNAEKYALRNISLKFEKGQTIGIIGGTGSGKTTLVDLIARFADATEGDVLVNGRNVREYKLPALRAMIGIVSQNTNLFSGTILENMLWADPNASMDDIRRALEIAQATFVFDNPEGLERRVEQGGRNLSGGQRQRLAIARALVGDPKILILDDSSSALDFATDAALRAALAQYAEGRTIIMVSQRASTLRDADQIVVMDDGQVAGVGTHEALFESNNVYREICLSQLSGQEAA